MLRPGVELSLCGAIEARRLIEDCYEQAIAGLWTNVQGGSRERQRYWLERVKHLIGELNWIDKLIRELGAAPEQEDRPDNNLNRLHT